jgi:hypothetical protein
MSRRIAALLGACAITGLAACNDPSRSTDGVIGPPVSDAVSAQGGSGAAWNNTATQLIATRLVTSPALQIRILTYLSVAQYNAVIAVDRARESGTPASAGAAVAAASVVVLTSSFPADAALLESTFDAQFPATDKDKENIASGEAIGRQVGAEVVAYAATDNFNLSPVPPIPVGPGFWTSGPTPIIISLFGTRPFGLTSPDQFRPPPPPAFGSAAFLEALEEIRRLSDNRTPDQLTQATLWAPRIAAWMNQQAVGLIQANRLNERSATRVLALANMAAFDANIACWDAKFAYWLIRPSQADPAITLPIGLPNHPSYTSGHSCNTASYAAVLSHFFPRDAARLQTMVVKAGLSRMYGGIHYRFDCEVGQDLGRKVAAYTLSQAVEPSEPIPLD